jgi:pimeloyl-ACP methyl ester carboxylesterase
MTTTVRTLGLDRGKVDVTIADRGKGQPFLLLHGGAGPQSVGAFAELLSDRRQARVITPTHPGFAGTIRPAWLTDITGLAESYSRLLDDLDLTDVIVIGNSIGGWIAAELALRGSDRLSGIVLVDAVGIEVEGHPVADVFPLSMDELSRLSYHDPARFRIDPDTLSEDQKLGMAANRAALGIYGGRPAMVDPTLRERIAKIAVPTLVLWGESDQIVDPDYGRAYAAAIPDARFHLLAGTGHVPQIEAPEQLLGPIGGFADLTRGVDGGDRLDHIADAPAPARQD